MKNLPIFFDTETGGLESKGKRASSVLSLSTSRGNEIKEIFAQPAEGSWLSEFSKQNILPQVSRAKQTFTERQAVESFIDTLRQNPGSPLVGYNSAGFDLNFLQNRAALYGLDKELQQVLAGRRSIDIGLRLKMLTAVNIEQHIQKGTFTAALGGKTWGQATLAWGRGAPLADQAPQEYKALSQMKAYANAIEGAPRLAGDRMARGWKQEQLFALLYPGDDLVKNAHQSTADVLMTRRLFEALPSGNIQTRMATEEFAHGWLKTTVEGYNKTIAKDAGEIFHSTLLSRAKSKIPNIGPRGKALLAGGALLAGTLGIAALLTQNYFQEESIYDKIGNSRKENKLNQLAEDKFSFVKKSLRKHGEKVGTGHDRIFFDKSLLSEEELTERLGFTPVSIAIPEAGQTSWTSFRHEENNFHIHEHGEKWVIHEDAHAASTMLAKRKSREEGFVAGVAESFKGIPHVLEEGVPGAYYYLKGKLTQSQDMLERLEEETSITYKQQLGKIKKKFQKYSNRFSGKDDDYNTIEGLGHKGIASQLRKENTDFGSGVDIVKATRRAERLYKSTIRGLLKEKGHSGKINWTSNTDAGDLTLVAKSESGEMLFGIDRQFSNNQVDLTSIEIGEGLRGSGIGSSFYDIESRILKRVGLSGSVVKSPVTNPVTGRMQANLYDSKLAYNYEDIAMAKLGTSPDQFHSKLMNREFSKSDWKDFGGGTFTGKIRPPQTRTMFSGRDDEYNTVEGLQHGGWAQRMRKLLTPFGSGWDSLKNLLKGSETIQDIIKSPEFRESLSSAVKGDKLGAGSFGEAFKMTTKFRGEEFSFVRKTGFIGKDEISTMRRFQDDFAPTVYSSGTDKFAKDYIDMELFEGTTLGRATNPEQYVGRAKEALTKMHEQGYSHLDPHKSNIFVTKEGNVGLIDFGTAGKLGESARVETAASAIYMEGRHGARTKQMDFDVLDRSMSDPGSFGKTAPPSAKTLDEGRRKKRIQQKKIERSQMNLSASRQMSINARNGGKKSNM